MIFDINNPNHVGRLRPDYRDYSDLENVAAFAEREILGFYTRRTPAYGSYQAGPNSFVLLRGFNPDPMLTEPMLLESLLDTTAVLIEWKVALSDASPIESSRAADRDGATITMRPEARFRFPPHWNSRLREFSLITIPWGL